MVLGSFPSGLDSKESACNAGDPGLFCGSGRFPGERSGNPLQYSCLENLTDRGAWWAIVHRVTKSWILLTLSLSTSSNLYKLYFSITQNLDVKYSHIISYPKLKKESGF